MLTRSMVFMVSRFLDEFGLTDLDDELFQTFFEVVWTGDGGAVFFRFSRG